MLHHVLLKVWVEFVCPATRGARAPGDRVMFHLEMRSGIARDISALSFYPNEAELLLPHRAPQATGIVLHVCQCLLEFRTGGCCDEHIVRRLMKTAQM